MKTRTLFLISAVFLLLISCVFDQTSLFASDSPADQTIDIEETNAKVIVDDNFVIVEEVNLNYDNNFDKEVDEEMNAPLNEKIDEEIDEQIREQMNQQKDTN
jgi:hypothetical protein